MYQQFPRANTQLERIKFSALWKTNVHFAHGSQNNHKLITYYSEWNICSWRYNECSLFMNILFSNLSITCSSSWQPGTYLLTFENLCVPFWKQTFDELLENQLQDEDTQNKATWRLKPWSRLCCNKLVAMKPM